MPVVRARSIGQLARPFRPVTLSRPAVSTAIAVWLTDGLMCFRSRINIPRTLSDHGRRRNGSASQISIFAHDIHLDGRQSPDEALTSCQVHIISPASGSQSHNIRDDALDHPLERPSGRSALGPPPHAPWSLAPKHNEVSKLN